MDWEEVYPVGAFITGVLVFIGIWIYAISSWGLLIGLALGWIPAAIAGVIAGFAWPLVAAALVFLIWAISRGN